MMTRPYRAFPRLHGAVRFSAATTLVLCLAAPAIAANNRRVPPSRAETAQKQFARSEAMRQELEGSPQGNRTKLDYGRVMEEYRAVYHGDPASGKAGDAITAVAELLAEEGRLFAERKPLEDAISQYEFLRKQYPANPLRLKGQLVEAEILDKDLNDAVAARTLLQDFLKANPNSTLLPEAKRQLANISKPKLAIPVAEPVAVKTAPAPEGPKAEAARPVVAAAEPPPHKPAIRMRDGSSVRDAVLISQPTPLPAPAAQPPARVVLASGEEPAPALLTETAEKQTPPASGGRVMVTDIRHWSTPNYTRVAIDLGGEVRFQAGRASNPDRIYFDLYNTRLAPQLMGHLISVESDPFLKDIRSAQFTTEITRIVLDVNSIAEYSAFLLPNPYRLIIDVHGRKSAPENKAAKAAQPAEGPGVTTDVVPSTTASSKPSSPPAPAATTNSFNKPARAKAKPQKEPPLPETVNAPVVEEPKPAPEEKKSASTEAPSETKAAAEGSAAPVKSVSEGAATAQKPDSGGADVNGRETGVANPPGDVSTSGQEDEQPRQEQKSSPTPSAPAATPDQQNLVSKKQTANGTFTNPMMKTVADRSATQANPPQIIQAKSKPNTLPVVDAVVPAKEDATNTPPFANAVVPGAAPVTPATAPPANTPPSADKPAEEIVKADTPPPPDSAALGSLAKPAKKKHGKHDKDAAAAPDQGDLEVHEAEPNASGERSLVRALGLKIGRIVIDPGHGGHDVGTVGPDGVQEKDVVLDVGLRLGKLLRQRLGADVTFTRSTDTFVPLETRTAIANKAQADLFVSIHANSSTDASARGVETYYLNFTSSPEALDVAARENAVSQKSVHELQDLVKKITLKDKVDESKEFAGDVEQSLYQGIGQQDGMKDRGVKKAPFVVLIGANMPSILTEISFVSNPEDAKELRQSAYRQRVAESLYAGIARYINGLSSVRVAATGTRSAAN